MQKLIVGLGNVGEEYKNTRHNAGFIVLDKLAEMVNGQWLMDKKFSSLIINHQSTVVLSKPTTMMNNSGDAVAKLISFYHIQTSNLWVIHDDLDINLGQYKIQFGKGPKVHNGINSVYEKIGTDKFWHVRIGVDNRDGESRTPGETYVLQNFLEEEKYIIDQTIEIICTKILELIR